MHDERIGERGVHRGALRLMPPVAVTALGVPARFIIAKLTVVATPLTLATTAYAPAMSFALALTDA